MSRVAIVIVTHNSASAVEACLESLRSLDDVEIVVVDNASTDTTCEEVSRAGVRLLANPENTGFAAAVNQGVEATSSPLILLLNPDVVLETALNDLIAAFDDAGTGAATGLLRGTDGEPQAGFVVRNLPTPAALIFEILGINRLWPANPVNWHYRCRDKNLSMRQRVEQPAGAFLMFSRSAWSKVGKFDEGFWPVWFEDVDFCARLRAAEFACWFVPAVSAKHEGAHSIRLIPDGIKEKYWYGNLLRYAEKHYPSAAYRAVCAAVAAGSVARGLIGLPRKGLSSWKTFRSVRQLAFNHLTGRKRSQ